MNSKVQAKKVTCFFRNVSNDHWNVCSKEILHHFAKLTMCNDVYCTSHHVGFEFVTLIDQQDVLLWPNEKLNKCNMSNAGIAHRDFI